MAVAGRYQCGLENLAAGDIDLIVDDICVMAFEAAYVANFVTNSYAPPSGLNPLGWTLAAGDAHPQETHPITADVPGWVATSPVLTGKTIAKGKLNANDVLFTALPGSKTITQFVVGRRNGAATTFVPLCLIAKNISDVDISFATGTGVDLIIRWENVAPFIFEV